MVSICPVHNPHGERANRMVSGMPYSEVSDAANWEFEPGLESNSDLDELSQ